MKIEHQGNAELSQLSKLVEDIPVAMLTSPDSTGVLVSRPMAPLEMDGRGTFWFFTDIRSTKVDHLDPVNLSFTDVDGGTYVSLSGHGEIETDKARIEKMWTPAVKPWFPEGPDSPNIALLKFLPDTAEFWDAPSSKMVRMFAMAASVIAGKPIGMGEHDTLTDLSAGSTRASLG